MAGQNHLVRRKRLKEKIFCKRSMENASSAMKSGREKEDTDGRSDIHDQRPIQIEAAKRPRYSGCNHRPKILERAGTIT